MKKNYVSPTVTIEYYRLTQAIASCATKIGFLDSDCVKKDPDATNEMKNLAWSGYFSEKGGCRVFAIGMDEYDKICYHTNANAAFNS